MIRLLVDFGDCVVALDRIIAVQRTGRHDYATEITIDSGVTFLTKMSLDDAKREIRHSDGLSASLLRNPA